MAVEAEWSPWNLDDFRGSSVGGHSYILNPVSTGDTKQKAIKAFNATAKCQVVHYHPSGEACADRCEVYGVYCPQTMIPKKSPQGGFEI